MPAGHDISSGSVDLFPDIYVSTSDETIPANSQVVLEDVFECSANYVLDLADTALLVIQSPDALMGRDASGGFLEIV
jgi:hypothetical protein